MIDLLKVKAQTNRVQSGVVEAYHLDKVPVARTSPLRHHYTVMRVFLTPMTS